MTSERLSVAVVGAGVIGLAAAGALGRRGHAVTTFDPEPPGTGQSFGRVRAFRVAHPTVEGVLMAVQSLRLWRDWEQMWGETLVDEHGLLLCDPEPRAWIDALTQADQPYERPTRARAAALCPLVDTERLSPEHLVFDPQAGAIDVRSTIEWLLARAADNQWHLVHEHVHRIQPLDEGAAVELAAGPQRFDAVLLTAGAGTDALAGPLGLHLDTAVQQRTWATIEPSSELPPTALWMELMPDHRYGWAQPAPDGRVTLSGDWSSNNPRDTSAGSLAAAIDYARTLMPKLDPTTARPQEMQVAPVTVPRAYPFAISTIGRVVLMEGNQLFKFAPLLGEWLADAVEGHPPEGVPTFQAV